MNKRLITGMAVGAGLIGSANSEAAASASERCAPIYDEVNQGQLSPALQQAIGRFNTKHAGVNVQILDNAKDRGIQSIDDARDYLTSTSEECNWDETSAVQVFISNRPKLWNVRQFGKVDDDITDSAMKKAEKSFINDLRDPETSQQEDVARLLDNINPYIPNSKSEAKDGGKLPVTYLGYGLLGILAIGGATLGGLRIQRGRNFKKTYLDGYTSLDNMSVKLNDTHTNTTDSLQYVPADDAIDLRQADKAVSEHLVTVDDAQNQYQTTYKRQRLQLWPDLQGLRRDKADLVDAVLKEGEHWNNVATTHLQELDHHMVNLEKMFTDLGALVDNLNISSEGLKSSGWDIGNYDSLVDTYAKLSHTVKAQREEGYIEKPADSIDAALPSMKSLLNSLKTLPERRYSIDAKVIRQEASIVTSQQTATETADKLDKLRQTYNPNCYEDLDDIDRQLSEITSQMNSLHTDASAERQQKSLSSIEKAESLAAQFDSKAGEITNLSDQVSARIQQLGNIVKELPSVITSLDLSLESTQEYAFTLYKDDVEDEVRSTIKNLVKSYNSFKDSDLKAGQPDYLAIDKTTKAYRNSIQQAMDTAKKQKQEMDSLRSESLRLSSIVNANLNSTRSYIASHQSDIGGLVSLSNFSEVTADTTLNRQNLVNQVTQLNSLKKRIDSAKKEAQAAVQRAEAEREAAAVLAAAAAEAARQSSYNASSYSSFTDTGGSYGGGSDYGGSYGGGSDSGGSW